MRYYFNHLKGPRRIDDPEGGEFDCPRFAQAEAEQVARDLAAQELHEGKAVPHDWAVELADADGEIHATIPFVSVMVATTHLGSSLRPTGELQRTYDNVVDQRRRTLEAIEASREARREIRKNCGALWKLLPQFNDSVRELARLSDSNRNLSTWRNEA